MGIGFSCAPYALTSQTSDRLTFLQTPQHGQLSCVESVTPRHEGLSRHREAVLLWRLRDIGWRDGGTGKNWQNQKGFSLLEGRFSHRRSVFKEKAGAQSPCLKTCFWEGCCLGWAGERWELLLMSTGPVFLCESGSACICIVCELQENKQKQKWWQKSLEGEPVLHRGISET